MRARPVVTSRGAGLVSWVQVGAVTLTVGTGSVATSGAKRRGAEGSGGGRQPL
jgi:hypothetical protein